MERRVHLRRNERPFAVYTASNNSARGELPGNVRIRAGVMLALRDARADDRSARALSAAESGWSDTAARPAPDTRAPAIPSPRAPAARGPRRARRAPRNPA